MARITSGAQHVSDEEIVDAVRTDSSQFAVLIDRYSARLNRYLARLGVRNAEDRDDMLQDVFVKVYRNLNGFDTSLSFSAWVYRITHNEAMSFFRSRSVRVEGHLVQEGEAALAKVQSELAADTEAEQRINAEHLSQALARISPKYREVIVLRFFEERDYSDISDILEIPMGSVATLLHRAKKALRDELRHIQ